jgi:hypothetical protein
MESMILTMWIGTTVVFMDGQPVQIGYGNDVSPGCVGFRNVRRTLEAEFEVRDEKIEARPA